MKTTLKNLSLVLGVLTITSVAYGQKKNETSAAVEFKNNYMKAMMMQDAEKAKKALIAAKGFIDLAAAHPDTENSQKTLWYKGEIYANFLFLGMQIQDTAFIMLAGEDALDQSIEAFTKGYPLGKKYKIDITNAVNDKIVKINTFAGMLYQGEQYKEAAELYEIQSRYSSAIESFDSSAIYNASICYERVEDYEKAAKGFEQLAEVNYKGTASAIDASRAYRKAGNLEKAMEIINTARVKNPSDRDLLLELVNANIDAGDAAGAEKALNDAIATDPENKHLHYTIGTIYIDLNEFDKAEKALNKALEIDPSYADAQYQLGAHLVTWAGKLKTDANDLKFGDPNYNKLIKQSDETYARALVPLENYITAFPEDKAVLNILFQIHRSLGNSDKALEYKKRAEGIE